MAVDNDNINQYDKDLNNLNSLDKKTLYASQHPEEFLHEQSSVATFAENVNDIYKQLDQDMSPSIEMFATTDTKHLVTCMHNMVFLHIVTMRHCITWLPLMVICGDVHSRHSVN